MISKEEANRLIPYRHGIRYTMHEDGDTMDIVNSIVTADKTKYVQLDLKNLAPRLKGRNKRETAENVRSFVKKYITYVLDVPGWQGIKAPAATWLDGYGDCKSRTMFQAAILKHLGINASYRFASYTTPKIYTHVYLLVQLEDGLWYPSDTDMEKFGIEKTPIVDKLDKVMSKVEFIAGASTKENSVVGSLNEYGVFGFHKDPDEMNDFDMLIAQNKERAEVQKAIAERIAGVGCPHSEKMQDKIDVMNDLIEIRANKAISGEDEAEAIMGVVEDAIEGLYNFHRKVSGIGDVGKKAAARKAHKAELKKTRPARQEKRKAHRKEAVKKLKNKIKKAGKAFVKLATAPQRLFIKGLLSAALPKAAPFFLYLFVTDPAIIAKLPEAARRKRKTAEKLAHFITHTIGMKPNNFMAAIRSGIMKKYHKSPEQVIAQSMRGQVSGIGDIGFWDDIIKILFSIIKNIGKLFKKQDKDVEKLSANDVPDPSKDFGDASEEDKKEISNQVLTQKIEDPQAEVMTDGGESLDNTTKPDGSKQSAGEGTNPDGSSYSSDEGGNMYPHKRSTKSFSN